MAVRDAWDRVVFTAGRDAARVYLLVNNESERPLAGTNGSLFWTPDDIGRRLNMRAGDVQAAIVALASGGFVSRIRADGAIAA